MSKFKTFDEIVEEIVSGMSEGSRQALKSIPREDMIQFHHTTGRAIRNEYLLWDKSNPLTSSWDDSCISADGVDEHPCHPDAVSTRIMEAVWEKVNGV